MIILYFFVYSFVGWLYESTICSLIKYRRFVNRGFLNGPYCPIYGVGAVIGILLYKDLNHLQIFLFSMFSSTLLELITGYILEKVFKRKWWDYSNHPINYKGYICIMASLIFGSANVLLISVVHPRVSLFFDMYNSNLSVLVLGLILLISIDTLHSIRTHISLASTYKLSHDYFIDKRDHVKNAITAIIR